MQIEVSHLKKHFGRTRAVDDISFSFASGQVFGFVGPNGAGKTTTMRILATLDEPTGGDAIIDGVSVVEDPERARQLVGYMPDSLPTHRDMSVHEYLDFFARAYNIPSPRRQQVLEQIEQFTNLMGIREKMLNALSKGMKQRVSLARALVHDPPVLIMDEPAAGLDPRARVELRELLKALAQQGKAILISSHILSELAEICDGAVIIERGQILSAGRLHDMVSRAIPRRAILIRPLDPLDTVLKQLLEMPFVEAAQIVGPEIEAQVDGPDEAAAEVLSMLIQQGVRVLEFRPQRFSLEHVFMSITKGEVQ